MTPTILVAGATGNTGQSTVRTLSRLLSTTGALPGYKILALSRSLNGKAAQQLAQLPGVEVIEQNWVEITTAWLHRHGVVRAFIASHNQPNQFAEESTFHLAALHAGVKYVVRISTMAANVRPDCPAYYPRTHWAIETLLSSPAFQDLQWTSLQSNVFSTFYLASAVEFIKNFRKTGQQDTLRLIASRDAPVGIIEADDVGTLAAHLLAAEDPTKHNKAKYVLNGPTDVTGSQIVKMVEDCIDTQVEDVQYKDLSFVDEMAAQSSDSKNVILSMKHAMDQAWAGECSASTTSKEVLELAAAPKTTPAEVFKFMLEI